MNINLYENKSGHYEHIYFIIKLYENKSGHYCDLGNGLLLGSHVYPLLAW